MRKKLKEFRETFGYTQDSISEKIGVNRATYAAIESGARDGRLDFWQSLQNGLFIPDAEMWALMQNTDE